MEDKSAWVDKDKIYAISRNGQPTIEIVMYTDPAFRNFKGICYMTIGERGHMIEGHLEEKTRTGFIFIPDRAAGSVWEFIEVTYDNFKNEYHKIVIGGEKILDEVLNTDELTEWYHREFPKR